MTDGIYLLLGSNIGDRRKIISDACELIRELAGEIVQYSGIYETEAWGKTSQPAFLNQVIEITTKLVPKKLLAALQLIENKLGRVRHEKWGERTIDIDVLYYGDLILQDQSLSIPHPEISSRRFTLVPLVEIAADFINPVHLISNAELLKSCKDELKVNYVTSFVLDIK
jgi:2-amino-4-hydroxy-6-hydroxymethyldihydropteridine diphosphokinase